MEPEQQPEKFDLPAEYEKLLAKFDKSVKTNRLLILALSKIQDRLLAGPLIKSDIINIVNSVLNEILPPTTTNPPQTS